MNLLSEDTWRAVLTHLDSRSICSLSQASRSGWQASCYASVLNVQLGYDLRLEQRLASLVEYVTKRARRNMQVPSDLRPARVLLQYWIPPAQHRNTCSISQLMHCLLAQQVSQLVVWCTSSSDYKVIYTGDINKVAAMLASLVGVCTEHLETVNIRMNCYNTSTFDVERLMVRNCCFRGFSADRTSVLQTDLKLLSSVRSRVAID